MFIMLKVLLKSTALVLLLHAMSPFLQAMATDENVKKVSKRMPSNKEEEGGEEKELFLFNSLNPGFDMDEKTGLPIGWNLVDSAKNRDVSKPVSLNKKPVGVELLGENYTFYANVPALRDFDSTTFLFSVELRSTNPGVFIQYYDGKNAVSSAPYSSKRGEWETLNIEFTVDAHAKFHRLYSAILGAVKNNNNPSVDIKNITLKKKPIEVEPLGNLTVRSGREINKPSEWEDKKIEPSLPNKLQNYLSTSKKPILLFGCGHSRRGHPHQGAFTIDRNAEMGPDICESVTASFLTQMAENGGEEKFYLIWEEHLNLGVINKSLTEPLYKLLAKGGYLVFKEEINEFNDTGKKLGINTASEKALLFIDSVKSTFNNLNYLYFDYIIWQLKNFLIKNKIITPIGNGDWDYSKVELPESQAEKTWFCSLEDWNKVINANPKEWWMDLGIDDFNKDVWIYNGQGPRFNNAVRGLKAENLAFIEGNSVYVKFIISKEKLNRMKLLDENRKILYEIDPTLATYKESVYIAQK